ncbi:MAG: amidohydrolase family protein [Ardenticatenales bacterium]|nr:amidohydrolase family protein [Ardenticatenales bacterium]
MTLLIRHADFLLRDADRVERDVDVLVEGARIVAIGPGQSIPPGAEVIDATGCAVVPGLVNAHTHLYQNFLKGVGAGLRLVPWCDAVLFPTVDVIMREKEAGNQRPAYLWSALGALEMIRAGTTCCQNMDVAAGAVFQAWDDIGLRGVGAITLADDWIPAGVMTESDALRRSALDYLERWHDTGGRITVSLGPSAPFLCSDSLLEWVRETAHAHDVGIHIHVSETAGEVEQAQRNHGFRPVERLEAIGLLSERVSAVHCVYLNQAEIEFLSRRGVTVVHCPKSNMKLADGIMPWPVLKEAGVAVALGNDGCASNDLLDMWEEMRVASLLGGVAAGDPAVITPSDVFWAATEGGAQACRVDAGMLDPGRLADLIVVDLSTVHLRPVHDILQTLVFCARATDVHDTIIDGRVVMRQRQVVTVDEGALLEEADAAGRELYARARHSTIRRD